MMPTSSTNRGLQAPAHDAFAVTPHDSNDLATPARALYIGGAGAVKLVTLAGTTVTFAGLAAGQVLPVGASRVFDTDTDATLIVGLV
jgi:hypothetical protein